MEGYESAISVTSSFTTAPITDFVKVFCRLRPHDELLKKHRDLLKQQHHQPQQQPGFEHDDCTTSVSSLFSELVTSITSPYTSTPNFSAEVAVISDEATNQIHVDTTSLCIEEGNINIASLHPSQVLALHAGTTIPSGLHSPRSSSRSWSHRTPTSTFSSSSAQLSSSLSMQSPIQSQFHALSLSPRYRWIASMPLPNANATANSSSNFNNSNSISHGSSSGTGNGNGTVNTSSTSAIASTIHDPFIGKKKPKQLSFAYDKIFNEKSTQMHVFAECVQLLNAVLDGWNGTIVAYGPSGSGKTYTMEGAYVSVQSNHSSDNSNNQNIINHKNNASKVYYQYGIIPNAIDYIFSKIEEQHRLTQAAHIKHQSNPSVPLTGKKYSVSCSYVEVYNEVVYDLLANNGFNSVIAGMKFMWFNSFFIFVFVFVFVLSSTLLPSPSRSCVVPFTRTHICFVTLH
jgi:hypothetical protein